MAEEILPAAHARKTVPKERRSRTCQARRRGAQASAGKEGQGTGEGVSRRSHLAREALNRLLSVIVALTALILERCVERGVVVVVEQVKEVPRRVHCCHDRHSILLPE